ncbi:hypothetical protein H1_93 [Efunavirus H1]|uniref:Uncharacterized protein n=1 Tax=Enterococcus phage H1 TaxID=2982918 RepID=A0AAE9T799_9CAUD|nr:hypothetical protein H1_93 [Enterococcus phage H1]
MLITRSYKRKRKAQEKKEKIMAALVGVFVLLIILFFVLTPIIITIYSVSVGFVFTFKNVIGLIFLYLYSWGSLYLLYDHIFG